MEVSAQNGSGGVNGSGVSRAERFEDEKRRIIESCFGKKDEDGSLLESYITHIRILEDSQYPSSPPPPNSDPSAKKPRLIIVAVRKSGRVRVHKGRENVNGTFSIGKTWMLDDLSAIQSFTGPAASREEEEQKQWAGIIGFTVTVGKPYYWQANTQKEKQFFIASLVKIYTKYTGGKSPELIGFDEKERNQLTGGQGPAQRPPPPALQAGPPPSSNAPYVAQARPPRREPSREPPMLRKQPSREAVQRPPGQIPPSGTSFTSQTPRPQLRNQRIDSPNGSMDSNPGNAPLYNQQGLRRIAGSNKSQESFARSDDGASLPPRSRNGLNGAQNVPGRFQDRNVTPNSQRATTPDSTVINSRDNLDDVPPVPAPLTIPPERRRPPMPIIGDARQRAQTPKDNIVPAPLSSPATRRDDLRPPTRSNDRASPRERETAIDNTPPANGSSQSEVFNTPPQNKFVQQKPRESAPESAEPVPVSPIETPAVQMPEEPREEIRPGLGPMIKKKSQTDVKATMWRAAKAANAFNSFKPRAGGAAERFKEATQAKPSDGPDGITGVVPAPSLLRAMSSESEKAPVGPPIPTEPLFSMKAPVKINETIPEVKITVPPSVRPNSVDISLPAPQESSTSDKSKPREVKRVKTAAERCAKELQSIGIDPSILGDRGGDLVDAWEHFGWTPGDGGGMRTKNIDHMKEEIERELNKAQAGGWLARLEQEDDRIKAVHDGLDKCVEECDELDALLTLYSVELGTLNEDIAYIEAQSQGLQVQAANQKLLQAELQALLGTISISPEQLDYLREASLESPNSIGQIESSLAMLFKAMLTIDPSLGMSVPRQSNDGESLSSSRPGGFGNSELGSMRVLQEKKDVYQSEISMFLRRLKPFLQVKFGAAVLETKRALEREKGTQLTRSAGKAKLDSRHHDLGRELLWKYSPLMLFSREVDRLEWEEMLKMYEEVTQPLYRDEFREALFAWKRIVRKPSGDEADLLFTTQTEKQTEGIVSTTRKLTVKRSQTLAKSLRSPLSDNSSKTTIDKSDGRLQPYEVFAGFLDELVPIMSMEQNFIVEFFHVSSLEQYDFAEAIAAAPPEARRGGDLRRPRVMDPNRDLAKLVVQSMEEIYGFFPDDIQGVVTWSTQNDPLQGVGVLAAVERKLATLEESSQEYLTRSLQKLHQKLVALFNKFLDEQVRAIEDTKVKINKRKGVISFIRVFPSFSLALESMLTTSHDLEVRQTVNQAYTRINKTMFESLKVIARENPGAHINSSDPEDKEALNYQILLIENMNHYLEEVDARANPVLEDWKQNATQEMDEHMTLYLGAVIRRPLGKLLDFLESTESLMLSRQPGDSFTKISNMPSHSKSTFKKVLANYDSKEVRKGIEQLKKRVEKHFGDADDPNLSRGLVNTVLQNCEKYYEKVEDRILTISRDVYDGDVIAEWARADVSAAFRK